MIDAHVINERMHSWYDDNDIAAISKYIDHSIIAHNNDIEIADAVAKAGDIIKSASNNAEESVADWCAVALSDYYRDESVDTTDDESALSELLSYILDAAGGSIHSATEELSSIAEALHGIARSIA